MAAAAAAAKAAEAAGGKPDVAAPGFSLFVYRTSVARGFDFAQFVKTTMQEVCQMLPLPVLPQTGFSSKSNPSTTFALDFNKPLYSTIKSNLPLRSARHSAS